MSGTRGNVVWVIAVVIAFAAGCIESSSQVCGALVCPSGYVCVNDNAGCVRPEQLTSCEGVAEGGSCSYPGVPSGGCRAGSCLAGACGEGVITAPEDCEGSNLDGKTCMDLGFYEPGGLACSAECRFSVAQCQGTCGDGTRDPVEQCDGDDLAGTTCLDLGYYGGTAGCSGRCTFDASQCIGRCGDDVRTLGESCDGPDLGSPAPDCSAFGFYSGGPVACNALCGFDTSQCHDTCGDNIINGPEDCDGTALGAPVPRCSDFGFYSGGPVSCNGVCGFDTSSCSETCGDDIVNGPEACDGANLGGADCTSLGYYGAAGLACNGVCSFDTSACAGFCGDRIANGGEVCDGRAPASQCTDFGFESGVMGCASCGVDFSECAGTYTLDASATSQTLFAVWGSGPSNVFAVGESGALVRFNGTAWVTSPSGTTSRLYGVWGSGPAEAFAAGQSGGIRRWTGSTWGPMTSNTTSRLHAVWGSASDDVFAVGEGGTIIHWDGDSWDPMLSGTTTVLRAIWGTASDDVFVVGESGVTIHWNGTTWSPLGTLPSSYGFGGLWGTSSSNVIAVAYSNSAVVYRWNGTAWLDISSGAGGAAIASTQISAVWASSPTDVFVAGLSQGTGGGLFHYNGATWTQIATNVSWNLYGIWGTGPDDLTVVGTGGVVLRWRGSKWLRMSGGLNSLLAVWGSSATDVFASGVSGTIEHYDGSAWSPMTSNTSAPLNDLWGTGPSNVFAVGHTGTVRRWTGAQWEVMATGTSNDLYAVWAAAPNNVYAGGDSSTLVRWNGSTWTPVPGFPGLLIHIRSIWGTGANDIFVSGFGNFDTSVVHWDGTSWTLIYNASGVGQIQTLWGSGPTDVFAAGVNAGTLHWNGSTWTTIPMPVSASRLGGTGPSDIFATGSQGVVLHFDGVSWSKMVSNTTSFLTDVWASTTGEVFSVGLSGTKLRRPRACAVAEAACGDGIDEDCDGYVDCADLDCAGDGVCASGGLCTGYLDVACNTSTPGSTAGAPARIERYGCDLALRPGRERVYRLPAGTSGPVTVTLTNPSRDLDLLVLTEGASPGCEPLNPGCIGTSANTGVGAETVVLSASASERYYVVVDSYSVLGASYSLGVSCP